MEYVAKSELKPRMLEYFRRIEETGEPIIVTSHNKPVLKIERIEKTMKVSDVFGSYWHSGRLTTISFADINNDGIKEIIAGGLNNETNGAVLAILDPRKIKGASQQDPDGHYYTEDAIYTFSAYSVKLWKDE